MLLTIVSADGRATVTFRQPSTGESATVASTIDSRGIIGLKTSDLAINCYNTVQDVLMNAGVISSPSLSVSFAGAAVAVPLRITSSSIASGMKDIVIAGSVQGFLDSQPQTDVAILVGGRMIAAGSTLFSARLREVTLLTASQVPIAQAGCSITRVYPATTTLM